MIHIEDLNLKVGSFALRDVCLDIKRGEYFVLLGASGSGKTLLLESLCGLHRIDSGRVLIDGMDVTHFEPRRRRIGYLPQDYALFPHLPVRYNVGFGLANPISLLFGLADESIHQLLEMAGIASLAHRLPGQLSGGEQQRVALSRALAVQPELLLLDEPVSALDERTRDRLCRELKRLQRTTKATTIHVCHNFTEMMEVADRVGVIDEGRIVQVGTPGEVLERPVNQRIAQFVQAENLLSGVASDAGRWLRLTCSDGMQFVAPHRGTLPHDVRFMVRPENVVLSTSPLQHVPDGTALFEGRVRDIVDQGPVVELTVECSTGTPLRVSLGKKDFRAAAPEVGGHAYLAVQATDVHFWADEE